MSDLNWLHLSDLHLGMSAQGWLWPKFETDFLADLGRLHEKAGPWHLLLFTGDMVRAGAAHEFARLDDLLGRICSRLKALGSQPKLITLPGNHDLMRPTGLDPKAIALAQFSAVPEMQADFWGADEAGYRTFANSLFDNYREWRQRSIESGTHLNPIREGSLIGDASYEFEADGLTGKVVTLNSTWLQFSEGQFRGRLIVHPLQLVRATPERAEEWLSACDLPIIATHQPVDWFTDQAQADWRSDIYPTSRFLLHAFGHMHIPETRTASHGGGGTRREFQAASLFGLERTSAGLERIQGYSAGRLIKEGRDAAIQVWPRRLTSVANGEMKLKADPFQDLDEDNSYRLLVPRSGAAGAGSAKMESRPGAPLIESVTKADDGAQRFALENIEVFFARDAAHEAVRRADQYEALKAWAEKPRAFWLISDWGLGEEEFIGSLRKAAGLPAARCFKLDLDRFRTKADFLEAVRAAHGVTFEEICDLIEAEGNATLILSDAPFQSPSTPRCHAIAADIESLLYATADYLENGRFVVITKSAPASHSLPVVHLRALDEPDIAAYVRARRPDDPSLISASTLSRLHRTTDGHPGRLDAALKQLEVVSLGDLVKSDPDLEPAQPATDVPAALPAMLVSLRKEDEGGGRSYSLLQSLSLFPGGEQLENIRRMDDTKPLFAVNATTLLDRHLIESVTYSHFGDSAGAASARLLIVPRPVREYVNATMSLQERERLDRLAVELYFGQGWKSGLTRGAMAARMARNPLSPPYELHNCNTVVLRTLLRAQEAGSEVDEEAAIRVGVAFLERQIAGGHYRNALALAEDLAPAMAESSHGSRAMVDIARAKCLRMTGRTQEARDAYLAIEASPLSKKTQQEIFLGLAQTYSSASHGEERQAAAEKVIKLGGGSSSALQARAILVQMEPDGPSRDEKLDRLLQKAKATKAHVIENNIRLFKAELATSEERGTLLRNVIDTSRASGDFYNRFRAIVRLFEGRHANERVHDADKMLLISAYHFFHNERIDSLFNRTHNVLWRIFEEEGDLWNLLSLFRHSSFIWRLAGESGEERGYIDALKPRQDNIAKSNLPNIGRERTYFLTRLSSAASS